MRKHFMKIETHFIDIFLFNHDITLRATRRHFANHQGLR
jgi:hypothetical protein